MDQIKSKAFWITTGDVGARSLGFLTTILLARGLGTEYYGLVTIGLSILGYGAWLSEMGLDTIGTRESAKPRKKREFPISNLFWFKCIAGVVVLVLSALVLYLIPVSSLKEKLWGVFLLTIIPNALLLDWYFTGRQKYRDVAFSKVLKALLYLACVYLWIAEPSNVTLVPWFYLIGTTAATLYLFSRLRSPSKILSLGGLKKRFKRILLKSTTIGLGSSFNRVVQLLPPIVIGIFISASSAGVYSAAMKIIIVGMLLDKVFVNLFLPMFTSYWSHSPEKAGRYINSIFRIMLTAGFVISLILATGSTSIIQLIFGTEYKSSATILQILSWFIGATFINSVIAYGLLAINQDQAYFKSMLKGGVLSALLITACAAYKSTHLTAAAVVSSEIIIVLFNYHEFNKHIAIKFISPLISAIAAAGISYFALQWISLSVFVLIPLTILLFLCLHYLFRGIQREEFSLMYKIVRQ